MNALYIGIMTRGTTSQRRAEALKRVTPNWHWTTIDTGTPYRSAGRISRSLAFRYRVGSVVRDVNRMIDEAFPQNAIDLVWIDKGVYLWPETVAKLRRTTKLMVHYTPDTAFLNNHSRFFNRSIDQYDLLVTTKSFEVDHYLQYVSRDKLFLTTQSFDSTAHIPKIEFDKKRPEAAFIGLWERDREHCIATLLDHGIATRVGGVGWEKFARRQEKNSLFRYAGSHLFGEEYTDLISSSWVGLGLLSKQFPELHTTRTFEIPACGTAIATERNSETENTFSNESAIFFQSHTQLARRLQQLWKDPQQLLSITIKGRSVVTTSEFDNDAIVRRVLEGLQIL